MVVTRCEAGEGDLCWVKGGCRWGRKEETMLGQKGDEPLRALSSGRTGWDAVLGRVVLFNARTVFSIPAPTIKGVALAGAGGNFWPQNYLGSLKIREKCRQNSVFSHICRVPGSGDCTWQYLGYRNITGAWFG